MGLVEATESDVDLTEPQEGLPEAKEYLGVAGRYSQRLPKSVECGRVIASRQRLASAGNQERQTA